MMREVCFCGWLGELEDRGYVYLGEGESGLACPQCGHIDRLDFLPEQNRRDLLSGAWQKQQARIQQMAA
jgi:hypothetical protein